MSGQERMSLDPHWYSTLFGAYFFMRAFRARTAMMAVAASPGTPMPSYAEAFEGKEDDVWHMVHYIMSLWR